MKLFKETNGVVEQVSHPSKSCYAIIGIELGTNNPNDTATPCPSKPDTPTPTISVPTVSSGSVVEKISNNGDFKFHPSPLSLSVNLLFSGSEHLFVKGLEKQPAYMSKKCGNGNQSNLVKLGGLSFPPVPPQCAKHAVDTR
ncbi:hypothetical protein SESBI_20179 [Sesbania bispinosa]|nr:hypothetical protein SESBI_20179 [Sesbania bispinosa]